MSCRPDVLPPAPLDIVVVSQLGGRALARTLRALAAIDAPCVVVGAGADSPPDGPRPRDTRFVPADVSVPLKRAIGLAAMSGRWVALIEDTCEPGPGWHRAFEQIERDGAVDAAGGPVTIASHLPPRCMALACMEYAAHAPRPDAGRADGAVPVAAIAGLNLLYRRSSIPPFDASSGLIESELNAIISRRGGRLVRHPQLKVTYCEADHAAATVASRFDHGRIYGGGLRECTAGMRRGLALLKCLALPPVLYMRAARAIPPGCRSPWRTRAWIVALALGWSAGEFAGLAAGRGTSLARWS